MGGASVGRGSVARIVLTVRGPARSTPPARSPALRYGAGFRRCRRRRRHAPTAPESTRDARAACSGRSFTTPFVLVEFTVIQLRCVVHVVILDLLRILNALSHWLRFLLEHFSFTLSY